MPSDTELAAPCPQDDGLWTMTLAAVRAADRASAEHLANDGYCSRVDVPEVGQYDSGWPRLRRSLGVPDKGPPRRSALFATAQSILQPFAYDDVPELVALIDYVKQRPDLRARLAWDRAGDEHQDWLVTFEAAQLPLTLLDRMHAVGAYDDDSLLALYLQREAAWLSDRLRVEHVFPLALTALDLDEALALNDRTRIEPLDAATQAARAPRSNGLDAVPAPVVEAATHAIVISDEIDNPGPGRRIFGSAVQNVLPFQDADLVCEALRLLTRSELGYAQTLLRPVGWADDWTHDLPALESHATVRRYPDAFDNYGWLRPSDAVPRDQLTRLPDLVRSLQAAEPQVRLASRRLSQARLRNDEDDQIVDACIGLEALLSSGRDELSHRLSLRAAAALSTRPPWRAARVYAAMRRVYEHRSTLVHGGAVKPAKRTFAVDSVQLPNGQVACRILEGLLLDLLERPGGWTPEGLDDLVLQRLDQPPSEDE